MDIQSLSDAELNRAMIWIQCKEKTRTIIYDDGKLIRSRPPHHSLPLRMQNYISDWGLTGPIMVKYRICLMWESQGEKWDATERCDIQEFEYEPHEIYWGEVSSNVNPLRAICEVYLMIEMATDN